MYIKPKFCNRIAKLCVAPPNGGVNPANPAKAGRSGPSGRFCYCKIWVKKLTQCKEFIAGDNTALREILHPDKENLKIRYSLAHAVVKPGKKTYLHSLKTSEIYYIIEGTGRMYIGGRFKKSLSGDTVYIAPGAKQQIENIGRKNLKFICVVDPAWRRKDEKVY